MAWYDILLQVGGRNTADTATTPIKQHTDRLSVNDRLTAVETLEDQPGADGVLTFTFAAAPDLVWIRSVGGVSRAGISPDPTVTNGIYCADDEPTPVTLSGQTVFKVYAPAGAVVSVWGYRYS